MAARAYLDEMHTIIKPIRDYDGYYADEQGVIFSTVQKQRKEPYRMQIYYHIGRAPTVRIKRQHVCFDHLMALAWFPEYNPAIHQVCRRSNDYDFKTCSNRQLFIIDKKYNPSRHRIIFKNGFDFDYHVDNLDFVEHERD